MSHQFLRQFASTTTSSFSKRFSLDSSLRNTIVQKTINNHKNGAGSGYFSFPIAASAAAAAAVVLTTTATSRFSLENETEEGKSPFFLSNNNDPSTSRFERGSRSHPWSMKMVHCDAPAPTPPSTTVATTIQANSKEEESKPNKSDKTTGTEEWYYNLFPKRQLYEPRVPYPLWDNDWDHRKPISTGDANLDREHQRDVRKRGVTKHLILIRHGQYDETDKNDEKRILTALGRHQAEMTGKRLARMIAGVNEKFGPCNVTKIRVSNLTRAKETADIIARQLPPSIKNDSNDIVLVDGIERMDPDPNLNEGRPAHTIPGGKASSSIIEKMDECHPNAERAFENYFHRADPPPQQNNNDEELIASTTITTTIDSNKEQSQQHEFEIIVGHANIIRYFFCRALQLPPEAWLRLCIFNCSLTYLTIRPTGTVSARMLGDIGHLGYENSTFSMHHGFNW